MTVSKSFVGEVTATGQEIQEVVGAIEPILNNVNRAHAIIACLSITLQIMDPEITPDMLQEGVKETSRFICMFLEETDGETPKEKMN